MIDTVEEILRAITQADFNAQVCVVAEHSHEVYQIGRVIHYVQDNGVIIMVKPLSHEEPNETIPSLPSKPRLLTQV